MSVRNTQKLYVKLFFLLAFAGFLAAGADFFLQTGAMLMIGLFVGVTALILALVFLRTTRVLDRMARGEDILAHWTYDLATWNSFTRRERDLVRRRIPLASAFFLLLGVVFLYMRAAEIPGASLFGGIVAVVFAIVAVVVWNRLRRLGISVADGTPEVLIGREGVWLNGDFFTWAFVSARLESVKKTGEHPEVLEIVYSSNVRYGRQEMRIRVPIPPGKESEAASVLKALEQEVR